jgi:hypothetical protein
MGRIRRRRRKNCFDRRVEKGGGRDRRERLTVGRTALALAVVAVVVAGEEGLLNVSLVGDGLAETVSSERHDGDLCFFFGKIERRRELVE